jgi:D-sedoheptulose 7-phosphate isomerase
MRRRAPFNADFAGPTVEELARVLGEREKNEELLRAVALVAGSLNRGGMIALCGNGGSCSQAEHFAAEMVGRFMLERPPLPAIALTCNSAIMTSIANDYGYDEVFARQVRGYLDAGDVLIGLTTSGRSRNVIRAFEVAREIGVATVAFIGRVADADEVLREADVVLACDLFGTETPVVQETHEALGHRLCALVEWALFGGEMGAQG